MNIFERIYQLYVGHRENPYKTDYVIVAWKDANKGVYASFKQRIRDVAQKGDMSVLYDMYNLMKRCTPPDALIFYTWITQILSGEKCSAAQNKNWAGECTDYLDRCMKNKKSWLGINIRTGEMKLYRTKHKRKDLLMIHSETPDEIWNALPQQLKSYLIEKIDSLASCNPDVHFSNMERKQLHRFFVLLARVFLLSHSAFLSEFLANLYDEVIEKKEPLAYCMYYFVVYDGGLKFMGNVLNSIVQDEEVDSAGMILINTCIRILVGKSLDMEVHTKEEWIEMAKNSNEEMLKEIMFAISKSKGNKRNKRRPCSIDELLKGNVRKIKPLIKEFVEKNTDKICLAYLLIALEDANCIQKSCKYMTFHRAIETFIGKKIGYDVPQKRYGELKEIPLMNDRYQVERDQRAIDIIEEWTPLFSKASK